MDGLVGCGRYRTIDRVRAQRASCHCATRACLKTLHRFKYEIIGICETRAKEEQRMVWRDTEDKLTIGTGSGTHHFGDVGFIIKKKIADKVTEAIIHYSRIARRG
ncbi:hypothetical protein Y032_0030g2041 [Ancylostoma ceylanicum]|uniref:Uncharacterized protein n=1 Tax=Ancylostoma ceylanicum TaxID=53326 RepID=A0A016UQE7_9BILA|nr:hypothetical protein Y032_0030g2041 [Ancylostoma ceylanicum]